MGIFRSLLSGRPDPTVSTALALTEQPRGPRFETSIDSGVLYGTPTLDDYIYRYAKITRAEALRVPAVKMARDRIAGALGQMPLKVMAPDGREATTFTPNLFQQPEPGTASTVTWTRVAEDLLLYERAWLKVLNLGWHGRVIEVRRLDPNTVTVVPDYVTYPEGTAKVWPDVVGLLRIDSPNGGLLDCSPAIRACIALERATLNMVDGAPPVDYFTPADDVDPFEDDEAVQDFLDDWTESRRKRSTAYVPAAVNYKIAGWNPEQLQLKEARDQAVLDVARLTGIDPEDLGVSTTSRTYQNQQDRRRDFLDFVLGPYLSAIETRLGMDDVTPHGYTVAFDTASFLRADDLTRAQTDAALIDAGVLKPEEARESRGLMGPPPPRPVQPAPAPQETAHG